MNKQERTRVSSTGKPAAERPRRTRQQRELQAANARFMRRAYALAALLVLSLWVFWIAPRHRSGVPSVETPDAHGPAAARGVISQPR